MTQGVSEDTQKTALKRFLESVGSDCPNLIYFPGDLKAIYHYTDLGGLQGIVNNHDLWLTHSRYSNDDEELTHGLEIVRETIKEAAAKPEDSIQEEYLRLVAETFELPEPEGVYICCFCEKDNLLSQWRSYGANGTGVSLGFNPTEFFYLSDTDSTSDSTPKNGLLRLWKVFYDQNTQKKLIIRALQFAYRGKGKKTPEEMAHQAAEAIQFFIPTFKNQDFAEEKEVRLIFTPFSTSPIKPRFRAARGMLVPYVSLKLDLDTDPDKHRLPLTCVRMGPSAHKLLNVKSTSMLLAAADYRDVPVESSDTPYRG